VHAVDDRYLLAKALKNFSLPPEILAAHQNDINVLVQKEIKAFGGNVAVLEDNIRARKRAIKLINLGLEQAARGQGSVEDGGNFDEGLAKNILLCKPIAFLYDYGQAIFEESAKSLRSIFKQSEVKVGRLWFRLISLHDFETLRSLIDLDSFQGTNVEYDAAIKSVVDITRKVMIGKFFRLEENVNEISHLGSMTRGNYPTKEGLVDIFILSLIIACMFREEEGFFDDRTMMETLRSWHRELETARQSGITGHGLERQIMTVHKAMDEDRKHRFSNVESQSRFIFKLLEVTLQEVEEFSDTLFFEPKKFESKLEEIETRFIQFFILAEATLEVRPAVKAESIAVDALRFTAKKIRQEVRDFYVALPDAEFSSREVAEFWSQKVILAMSMKDKADERVGLARHTEKSVNPEELAGMPIEHVVNATGSFWHWPEDMKRRFVDRFNPYGFVIEKASDDAWLTFLQNLSPNDKGWKATDENYPVVGEQTGIAIRSDVFDWVGMVLKKIRWENIHPSTIAALWASGSDHVRDIIFANREQLKVTLPALKSHYLFDHDDLRLLAYALERLVAEDKVKSEKHWQDILHILQYLPKAKMIIDLKRREMK